MNSLQSLTLQLGVIDYIVIAVLLLSALVGLIRGFFREVISLVSWIAAIIIATLFAKDAAIHLEAYISVPSARTVLAFGGLFIITIFIGGLINVVVRHLVKLTGLTGTDRMIGLLFGILRGALVVAILILVAGLTPIIQDPWWQQSVLIPHFQPLALWLRDLQAPELIQQFQFPDLLDLQPPPAAEPTPAPATPKAPAGQA